jgi:hypothetical protein
MAATGAITLAATAGATNSFAIDTLRCGGLGPPRALLYSDSSANKGDYALRLSSVITDGRETSPGSVNVHFRSRPRFGGVSFSRTSVFNSGEK